MSKEKTQIDSPYSKLIGSHPIIKQYFETLTDSSLHGQAISQLLVEAIQSKYKHIQKSKDKHYNVAYVKHKMFFSPSQKKSVTPKVTQIIPILSHEKHVIYGKPRVRLENDAGCPQHTPENCPYEHQFSPSKGDMVERKTKPIQAKANDNIDPEQDFYLKQVSNKALNCKLVEVQKQKESTRRLETKVQRSKRKIENKYLSPKASIPTNYESQKKPGKIRQRKESVQKYKNVQSKIKFLIDRDKKQKLVEDELQRQRKKIHELERNQQLMKIKLLQQQSTAAKNRCDRLRHVRYRNSNDASSLSSDYSEQSSEIDEELIRKYHRLKIYQNEGHGEQLYSRNHQAMDPIPSESFLCSCSRTLEDQSEDNDGDDGMSQSFDVKAFLANHNRYTPNLA